MALDIVLGLLWLILSIVLGGYILLFGRRALWATLGILSFVVTARLLAEFVADGGDTVRYLITAQEWRLLGIALVAGLLGILIGRRSSEIAVLLIGFIAGADLVLWLYDISYYLITAVAELPDQWAVAIGMGLIVLGGLSGIWFVRNHRDEALVLIAMLLGTEIIYRGLGLSPNSIWTAIILLSLALLGVVVQYADYLRELKGETPFAQYQTMDSFFKPPE